MLSKSKKLILAGVSMTMGLSLAAGVYFTSQNKASAFAGEAAGEAIDRTITFNSSGDIHTISGKTKYSISSQSSAGNTFYMIVTSTTNYDASNDYIATLGVGSTDDSTSLKFSTDANGSEGLYFEQIKSVSVTIVTASSSKAIYLYTKSNDGKSFTMGSTNYNSSISTKTTGSANISGSDNHYLNIVYHSAFTTYSVSIVSVTITYHC